MRELFVWYRVATEQAGPTRAAVLEMQRLLCAEVPGLEARLLMRTDPAAAQQTWMETYACRGGIGGISAALEATIQARALGTLGFIDGARHTEAFVATPS